jgi:hypothetical protein
MIPREHYRARGARKFQTFKSFQLFQTLKERIYHRDTESNCGFRIADCEFVRLGALCVSMVSFSREQLKRLEPAQRGHFVPPVSRPNF